MADEGDLAQEANDEFQNDIMAQRAKNRAKQLANLPRCENHQFCGNKVFVTDKGTIARFCKPCWEEYLEDKKEEQAA